MTRRRTTTRRLATVLAAALLLTGPGTAASADPEGFDDVDHGVGRFYANFDEQVLLFSAWTPEDICNGGPEPAAMARVFDRRDGSQDLKVTTRDIPIWLYSSPLGAPEFVDQTCGAIFDGDPTTTPVEPFAVGNATFKERITFHPDGFQEHFNGVNGMATSADGTQWKVRTWADFAIDDGVLIGDPAEFQGLAIHQVGG